MGKWRVGQHLDQTDIYKRTELLLMDCIKAKYAHKESGLCQLEPGGSPNRNCTACHFWAGAIHALEEVLLEPDQYINKR